MAVNLLTESAWKSFSKGKDLDDGALLKSLAKLGKTNDDKHDDVLAALDELEEVLNKQVVANARRKDKEKKEPKDVKEVKDHLNEMLEAVEQARKQVQSTKDAKAESEEEDSPALLTTKMVPMIRVLRKGEERLNALIGVVGPDAAVLITRKSVGASQKKVVANELGGSGVKWSVGTCWFEAGALIFGVDKTPGQLAKKVRLALIKQVDLKLRVKISAEDGGDEEDGEEGGEEQGLSTAPPLPDKDKMAFAQQLLKLRPKVEQAVAKKHPRAAQMQALVAAATAKAKGADAAGGLKDLAELELLLAQPAGDAGATTEAGVDPKIAFNARLAALVPRIQTAIQAGGANAPHIKLKFGQMGVLAKKPDYPGAHTVLDEIEELLEGKKATTTSPGSTDSTNPKAAEVDVLRASLQDDFDTLQSAPLNPTQRDQFQPIATAWMAAQDATDEQLHDRALLILKKIADKGTLAKLRQALAEGTGATGAAPDPGRLVRQRTFMLERWAKVPPALRSQLGPLRKAVTDSGADDDPDGLVDAIEAELDELLDELQDELDTAVNAGSTAGLRGVRARFESNELVQHLRSGPGIDAGKLLKAVLDAVDEIESEMTSA
jgi:hypothetical protein